MTGHQFPFQIVLFLAMVSPLVAAPRDAARHVASGIAKHRGGDFAGAEQDFTAAAKSVPDDPRVVFDQACALAAQGKLDDAEKAFDKAKLARDPEVASRSLYNLGWLAAQRAQAKFGTSPEDAAPEVRAEGMKHIEQAVAHYRSCLSVDPSHADARHNLELLRLWVKHIQEIWRQRDREKRRNETGLIEFLEMLQAEQVALRQQTRDLTAVEDSPRRRQAATLLGRSQRELSDEIEPLQKKLREGFTTPAAPPGQAAAGQPTTSQPLSPEQEQALAALVNLTQQTKNAMSRGATDLASNSLAAAEESQTQALAPLNNVYRAIAPFEHILQKGIRTEEKLIESTSAVKDAQDGDAGQNWIERDLPVDQRQVAGWAEILKMKAEHQLQALKSQPAVPGNESKDAGSDSQSEPRQSNAQDPAAQREALIAAYEKAMDLAPQAHTAATSAAEFLDRRAWTDAVPKEEEVLKLLKEIAESLPKQQNQNQDQKQNQDQDQQKNQQPDQKSGSQDQPQKDEKEKQDQSQSDQQKQKQNQKQKSEDQQPHKEKQQQQLSQQQAEAMLRQVREREREYRDRKKRQAVIGGVIVEKDW